VLGDGEVVRTGRFLSQYAYLIDKVWDKLAPADLEYLDDLACSFEYGFVLYPIAGRAVAIHYVLASSISGSPLYRVAARGVAV
jgi:hypothetical protein